MRSFRAYLLVSAAWAALAGAESALASSPSARAVAASARRVAAMPGAALILDDMTLAAGQSPTTLSPGSRDATVFSLTLTWGGPPSSSRTLRTLRLTNTGTGPGTVAQRDAELDTVRLYRDNGNNTFDPGLDVLLAQATAQSGAVAYSGLSQKCTTNTPVTLLAVTDVPLAVRDGDALDLALQSASDVTFDNSVTFTNSFPLAPAGAFAIDGMVAAQVAVGAVGSASVIAGSANNLVHHVVLPGNGYQADQLQQLAVVNTGTAAAGSDIGAMRAWVDDGDGSFDPALDRGIGTLAFTGARWQLTGLGEAVPLAGLRLFLTVDVPETATNGRTIRLALPPLPDPGVGMASGNDGPLDRAVESPIERAVSTGDRVTLAAGSIAPSSAQPGERDVLLLQLAATNGYGTQQLLDRLTIVDAGVGGTALQRDRAVHSLTLRVDGDGDGALGDSLADPALATAFFTDGSATFAGFTQTLAPGATQHLFVTAEVSPTEAADGDTLSTRVEGPLDLGLADTTRVVASWPLDSRARVAVDGMIAAQVAVAPTPAAPIAPADAGILALDVVVPRNGHADDTLQRIDLVNQGTAADTDLAEIRLWRDGGDGVATPGTGDDRDLGVATWTGAGYRSAVLSEPLGAAGARVFAVLRATATPRDSATMQLAVPVGGLTVASANDGPLDRAVASPTVLLISNSPLLASLAISPQASTPGQAVAVAMEVRNAGSESLLGVTPSALTPAGTGAITLQSGPTPASVDLVPGERDTLRWSYVASQPGTVALRGSASGTGSPSGAPRQSLPASSGSHQVFAQATSLDASVSVSLPTTANRGQVDLVPLTVRLTNAGGAQVSNVRFRGFRVALQDEAGAGIAPNRLLARVAVHQGTIERLSRTALEATGSEVDLTLASAVVIGAGESVDLQLAFDLLASTTVTAFRALLRDSAWFVAQDANSGAPVTVRFGSPPLPITTGLARLVEAPTRLEVAALPGLASRAGAGQAGVPLLGLRLTNPGTDGITNDVRVSALAVDASDTLGAAFGALADVVGGLSIRSGGQTLAARGVFATDGGRLTLALSPALGVPVNTPVDLFVSGDIAAAAVPGAFRLRLVDATQVDARDASTREPVPVVLASDPLPGPALIVEARADSLLVRGTPRFPADTRAGDTNVPAISITLHHPGTAGTAPLRMDSLTILSRDERRQPLAPSSRLARLRVLWDGIEAGVRPDPPSSGEATGITLGGRMLFPGDSATLEVQADLSATAPAGFLELSIFADGVVGRDANLGTRAAVVPEAGELPLVSGLTRIQAPPRTLVAGLASLMPAALAGDGREVAAVTLTLTNAASAGAGDISVEGLALEGAGRNLAAVPLGAFATRVTAYVGGAPWAQSATLSSDSVTATLSAAAPLAISPGAPIEVELRLACRPGVSKGAIRLGLRAAGVRVIQPGSALLQIQVQPAPGSAFPLWSEAGTFGAQDLEASYSNFPNPFPAGRGATSFAYYLRGPARAWLRLTALDGQTVVTLLEGAHRDAGEHQEDRWDGRNGDGRTVRNGVYVAELLVRYDDGTSARALRKVAVVR
ncbi:MAG TPA: hypothetical protein VGK89_06750 [Candidatus Eisenbacteria bacterium]|jgi:hypothetical protein